MNRCPDCTCEIAERYCPFCGYDSAMERVFVVQDQKRFDIGAAKSFGNLVFLLDEEATPYDESVVATLHDKLSSYTPEDYLLLLGNPCLIGWTVAIAALYSGGPVKHLQWRGKTQSYIVVEVDLKTSLRAN